MRFIATEGQRSDYTQAVALLEGFTATAVLADRGYDGQELIDALYAIGAEGGYST